MPQEGGVYGLEKVELLGVKDLQSLAGRFVNFFVSPGIVDGKLSGFAPKARFIRNSEGTYVPKDDLTQQMVAVYAHTQRLAALDDSLGAAGVNTWPRDIGISVRVQGGGGQNNAQYNGDADAVLLMMYTEKHLPIPVNGGILAHEHFHSLFYKLVPGFRELTASLHEDKSLFTEKQTAARGSLLVESPERTFTDEELTLITYFKGLNEGFADFWGWMYTGDPDFIVSSLPRETGRSMNVKSSGFGVYALPTQETVLNEIVNAKESFEQKQEFYFYLSGYAYGLGTMASRTLKVFSETIQKSRDVTTITARHIVGKALIKLLPQLKAADIGPEQILTKLAQSVDSLTEDECVWLNQSLAESTGLKKYSCQKNQEIFALEKAK